MRSEWEDSLDAFAVAHPSLAVEREMQRRTESKFAMPVAGALALVPALCADYALLPAGAALVATYASLYFDTADLEFFHAHRRGVRVRQKVRIRHYPDRAVSFLEVKMRVGDGVTAKVRRQRVYDDNVLGAGDLAFVHEHSSVQGALVPQVLVKFKRITLLSTRSAERVTIDFDLSVMRGSCGGRLQDIAVVEVKQAGLDRDTSAMAALRAAGCRERWASKYCVAIAFTSPEVRATRLRAGLRALEATGTWAS